MTSPIGPAVIAISLLVYDKVDVSDIYEATSCSFVTLDDISFGYEYDRSEDAYDNLCQAYDIVFDETLKRLEAKGIHLSL